MPKHAQAVRPWLPVPALHSAHCCLPTGWTTGFSALLQAVQQHCTVQAEASPVQRGRGSATIFSTEARV